MTTDTESRNFLQASFDAVTTSDRFLSVCLQALRKFARLTVNPSLKESSTVAGDSLSNLYYYIRQVEVLESSASNSGGKLTYEIKPRSDGKKSLQIRLADDPKLLHLFVESQKSTFGSYRTLGQEIARQAMNLSEEATPLMIGLLRKDWTKTAFPGELAVHLADFVESLSPANVNNLTAGGASVDAVSYRGALDTLFDKSGIHSAWLSRQTLTQIQLYRQEALKHFPGLTSFDRVLQQSSTGIAMFLIRQSFSEVPEEVEQRFSAVRNLNQLRYILKEIIVILQSPNRGSSSKANALSDESVLQGRRVETFQASEDWQRVAVYLKTASGDPWYYVYLLGLSHFEARFQLALLEKDVLTEIRRSCSLTECKQSSRLMNTLAEPLASARWRLDMSMQTMTSTFLSRFGQVTG